MSPGTRCEIEGFQISQCGSTTLRARFQDESLPMIRSLLCTSLVLVLLPQPTQANDIMDFLRAISGPAPRAQVAHRHDADPHAFGQHASNHRTVSNRSLDRRARHTEAVQVGASHLHGRQIANRSRLRTTGLGGSGVSFHVSIGNQAPAVPRYVPTPGFGRLPAPPLPTAPLPGQLGHLPHQFGEIVTCSVPVFTHVHIESAHRIAPHAVPVLVAVRDPNLGRFRSCVEQMVYVEVLVPPCPPRRVRVSPCRTRVRMDYGRYDVTIESRDGCVTVEYDN